jgi:hypothetical protein
VTRGALQTAEVRDVDVVERLHDARLREVCLEQLAGRRRLVVKLGDVPVAVEVVVENGFGTRGPLRTSRLKRLKPGGVLESR